MTVADRIFVDTNILLYATDPGSPWQQASLDALETVHQRAELPTISPQILREYLVVLSRGLSGRVPPLEPILQNAENIRAKFGFVEENDAVADALVSLIRRVPAAGKQVHDANIVATMQEHGIYRLLTNNEAHFTRFSHLITVVPLRSFM